jgi:phosphoribosylanthranilate isomerase
VAGAFLDRAVLVQVSEQPEAVLALAQRFGFQRVQPYLPRETRSRGVALLQAAGLVVLLPWADEPDQDPVPADLYVWEPSSTQTGVLGGSGQRHAMTHLPPGDFLLAGGLDAGNLRERVGSLPTGVLTRIRGVDAASRLEALAGAKDPAKVAAFVHLAHDLEFA